MGKFISQFRAKGPLRSMFRLFAFAMILMSVGQVANASGQLASQMDLEWLSEIITYLLVSLATMTDPNVASKDTDSKTNLLDPMGVRD